MSVCLMFVSFSDCFPHCVMLEFKEMDVCTFCVGEQFHVQFYHGVRGIDHETELDTASSAGI